MAEKIFSNIRLGLKIDTLANWKTSSLVLKKGEIAIATAASGDSAHGLTEPVAMIKIGDGEHTFSNLTWDFHAKASDVLSACKSEETLETFVNNVIAKAGIAGDEVVSALAERVEANENAIEILNGDDTVAGSVAKAIADAITALDLDNVYLKPQDIYDSSKSLNIFAGDSTVEISANILQAKNYETATAWNALSVVDDGIGNKGLGVPIKERGGIVLFGEGWCDGNSGLTIELSPVSNNVIELNDMYIDSSGLMVRYADLENNAIEFIEDDTECRGLAVRISQDSDNALVKTDNGLKVVVPASAEYSLVKDAEAGEYAAVYHLTKDGENIGASINIPKDMVVRSGYVDADGNIVLVLNDEENTEITIAAASLIEYVTSGSAADDMVVISVSDDHKVTASITDGSVTKAKLATDVQTSLGKADTAVQPAVLNDYYTKEAAEAAFMNVTKTNSAIDAKIAALDLANTYEAKGAETRANAYANSLAGNYATTAQGILAESALQEVEAGEGLTAVKEGSKVTIDFDPETVFILNCGGAQ